MVVPVVPGTASQHFMTFTSYKTDRTSQTSPLPCTQAPINTPLWNPRPGPGFMKWAHFKTRDFPPAAAGWWPGGARQCQVLQCTGTTQPVHWHWLLVGPLPHGHPHCPHTPATCVVLVLSYAVMRSCISQAFVANMLLLDASWIKVMHKCSLASLDPNYIDTDTARPTGPCCSQRCAELQPQLMSNPTAVLQCCSGQASAKYHLCSVMTGGDGEMCSAQPKLTLSPPQWALYTIHPAYSGQNIM